MVMLVLLKHSKQELLPSAAYPGAAVVLLSTPALMLAPSTSLCFKPANVGAGEEGKQRKWTCPKSAML